MNKKGFFFTMMSLLLLFAFVLYFSFRVEEYEESTERRLITLNSIVNDIQDLYVDAIVKNATRATFNQMAREPLLSDSEKFYTQFSKSVDLELSREFREISDLLKDTQLAYFVISLEGFNVSQNDSYTMQARLDYNFTLQEYDPLTKASRQDSAVLWRKEVANHTVNISLVGFVNPLTQTLINFTSDSTLATAVNEGYHYSSSSAPNYLQRFYNDKHESQCCGMVTVKIVTTPLSTPMSGKCLSSIDFLDGVELIVPSGSTATISKKYKVQNIVGATTKDVWLHSAQYGNADSIFSDKPNFEELCPQPTTTP